MMTSVSNLAVGACQVRPAAVRAPVSMFEAVHEAWRRREFMLHYQPQVDARTGAIRGVEALLRWERPGVGRIPPGVFVPLLEQSDLIVDVGAWVLARAVADQREWHMQGGAVPVAVNVSGVQLRQPDFVDAVRARVAVAPASIELEITESMLMEDVEAATATLKAVRALGVSVALDDFGTGYSSLTYLARLPVSTLKMGREFITRAPTCRSTMTILSTVVIAARALGLKVIAEGVESPGQLAAARRARCHEVQGFLFGRAVPAAQIAALLKTSRSKRRRGT